MQLIPCKIKDRELWALIQKSVVGYQINVMDMGRVRRVAQAAYDAGQDVTAAVHALLDQIAVKVEGITKL